MSTEMKTRRKVFLRDEVVNIILTDKSCKEYVESIISLATGIDRKSFSLELISNRVNTNANLKYSYVDAIYEDNSFIVNIEVNTTNTKKSRDKNLRYVCHMILKNNKPGDLDELEKMVYQINLNTFDILGKNEFIYESNIRDKKYNITRNENVTIIDINLAILENMTYTEINKRERLEKLLYIFVCEDKNNLDNLYSHDKIIAKVRDKMEDLNKDFLEGLYYDREEQKNAELYELGTIDGKNLGIAVGKEIGIVEGKKLGKKENSIEIAKSLLSKNTMSDEDIAEITKLSVAEIEKLKSE